ncbi:MAG TPA: DUF1501 domain-containing protein [Verrucomicrobiae bacterium]|nr:DUF1501 domain-containing protein [Verrucomicrobiae bacterium]
MEHYHFNILSRRSFLDKSVKTGLAVALSTLVDIPMVMKRALAEGSIGLNGKKLLFIWLRGANDGLNSVIPILDPAYAGSRPLYTNNTRNIGVPTDPSATYGSSGPADFPLGTSTDTYDYKMAIKLGNGFAALHPALKFLAPVYNAGDLALIHRVAYPRQSRSHFDSQNYWENGYPNNNLVKDGVLYRTMLEYIRDQGSAASPLTGVSIQNSLPLILRGSDAPMTNLTDPLRYDLLGIPNDANGNLKATNYMNAANGYILPDKRNRSLLQLQYENLRNTLTVFAGINFTEAGNTYRDDEVTDGDQEWANGNGGRGYYLFPTNQNKNGGWLRPGGAQVANKYAVPTNLQGFFGNLKAAALVLNHTDAIISGTEYGGFDTHSNQQTDITNGAHPGLNRGIGWAMYALRKYFTLYGRGGSQALPGAKCNWNDVVVITLSEFGRTTIQNDTLGTDHAEASVMFVAGGGIRGYNKTPGRSGVYGCSPSDSVPWVTGNSGSMFGVDNRYLKRIYDFRSVLGEVIRKHLGASDAQLGRIIPGYLDEANQHLRNPGTVLAPTYDRINTATAGEPGILA